MNDKYIDAFYVVLMYTFISIEQKFYLSLSDALHNDLYLVHISEGKVRNKTYIHFVCRYIFKSRIDKLNVRRAEDSNKVREDWKYVAMVLDRLFLWIFTIAVIGDISNFLHIFSV